MAFTIREARLLCAVLCSVFWAGCVPSHFHQLPIDASVPTANVPILIYHHIEDAPRTASRAQRRWFISPKKFESQMDWVAAHGFYPITMEQLIAHLKHGQILPSKPIVLTFDDGWKDHYSVVFLILKEHHFVGTFFVITDSVEHSAYMTWEQLRVMSAAGMDIQSHTVTHSRLSTLPLAKARYEIIESKKVIEERLHRPVVVLAYPFGSYDDDVIAITKAAGLEGAATVSGLNGGYLLRADRSYTLDRYAVENDDDIDSIARLKGFDPK